MRGRRGALASVFRAEGITGWRRQVKIRLRASGGRSPGTAGTERGSGSRGVRPDFVFRERRVAVFVDGCFWHACPRHGTKPKDHAAFWRRKLEANVARDRRVTRALRRDGWTVVRIWEHALRARESGRLAARLRRVFGDGAPAV